MNTIQYEFDYGKTYKFVLSKIEQFNSNLVSFIMISIPILLIQMGLNTVFAEIIKQHLTIRYFLYLPSIIIVCLFICPIVFLFFKTKIVITNSHLHIKRYTFNPFSLNRGFNDVIDIIHITECKYYNGPKKRTYLRNNPFSVYLFDWNSLVEIKTESKTYYVPIKNSKEFIAEINSRIEKINFFKKLNIDDLLLTKDGKKLSYNDLYVRWKESKIDGVYYVNENGEKVDLISY